jgi:quinoprotein glucose dehydrogenase
VPNGDTPDDVKSNPALAGVDLPPTGKASRPVMVVTKTLLIAGEGASGAPILRAYDKATGEVVGALDLPGPATAKPMTYMLNGKQHVVLAVAAPGGAQLVALTLP